MNRVQKAAALYLLVLFVALYGYGVGRFQLFPHHFLESLVQDFLAFSEGDPLEKDTTVVEKLKNDFGLSFERIMYTYPERAREGTADIDFPGLEKRPEPPQVFVDPAHQQGYRAIIGAFNPEQCVLGWAIAGA